MDEWNKNGGFVTSSKAVLDTIADFEYTTNSKFSVFKKENLYGKEEHLDLQKISNFEVRWVDCQQNAKPAIPFDSIPFIIVGKKKWDCHQGKQRNLRAIVKYRQKKLTTDDHDFRKHRKEVQNSKKLSCPVQIRVRHIVKFPTFQIEEKNDSEKHQKENKSKLLKNALKEKEEIEVQHRYYVYLPDEEHENHLVGEAGCLIQPVEEGVKKFIHTTVFEQNVTSTKEMRLLVEMYIRHRFRGENIPPKTNKRFWPSIKDLQNHIAFALKKQRNSTLDQVVVKDLVNKWQLENKDDKFYLRLKENVEAGSDADINECASSSADDEIRFGDQLAESLYGNQHRFLFVHQTAAQKRLLQRYGNDICLLDATYRTTKYALPLYFLCVPTNVNYMVVAMFILETEDTISIKEGLSVLKEWNPTWNPSYFMCDHAQEEIGALESIFPESFVYLCDFHREQSWERWLTATHNAVAQYKTNILELVRALASSMTEHEFETAKEALQDSRFWKESVPLRNWFERTWLSKHKRWVKAYRHCVFNILVNTNNGVERQNKALKYEYLDMKKTKSLSQLLSTIVTRFFPDSNVKYLRLNAAASELARSYSESIPDFLKNRPRPMIEHCFPRWEDSANIPQCDIDEIADGHFLVKSQNDASRAYLVQFKEENSDMPNCDCIDWKRSHFVCKHFMAVFRNTPFGWNRLPEVYRENPILNLDIDHINYNENRPAVNLNTYCNESSNEDVAEEIPSGEDNSSIIDLPLSSATELKRQRSRIGNLCQILREWVYHCSDVSILNTVETDLSSISLLVKNSAPKDGEFIIDNNPMTKKAGARQSTKPTLGKLPSRTRKRKGTGRVGVRAEKIRRVQTRKGADQLCAENNILHRTENIHEDVIGNEETVSGAEIRPNEDEDHIRQSEPDAEIRPNEDEDHIKQSEPCVKGQVKNNLNIKKGIPQSCRTSIRLKGQGKKPGSIAATDAPVLKKVLPVLREYIQPFTRKEWADVVQISKNVGGFCGKRAAAILDSAVDDPSELLEVIRSQLPTDVLVPNNQIVDILFQLLGNMVDEGIFNLEIDPKATDIAVDNAMKELIKCVNESTYQNKKDTRTAHRQKNEKVMEFKRRKLADLELCSGAYPKAGLKNPVRKNLCFANSLLQCLRVTEIHRVLHLHVDCHVATCFTCGLKEFLQEGPESAEPLLERMDRIWPGYVLGQQQDAHEFLQILMNEIYKKCIMGTHQLNDERLFYGLLRSTIVCGSCGTESSHTERFSDLSVSVNEVETVNEAVRNYFATEEVDYKCSGCGINLKALKRTTIDCLPRNFVIHIKRFNDARRKITKKIAPSFQMHLERHFTPGKDLEEEVQLFGVVVHYGRGITRGHYYSYVKFGQHWFSIDDMKISSVGEEVVKIGAEQSYILFYKTL